MESTSTLRLLSALRRSRAWFELRMLEGTIILTNGQRENGSSAGVAFGRSGIRAVFNTIAIRV